MLIRNCIYFTSDWCSEEHPWLQLRFLLIAHWQDLPDHHAISMLCTASQWFYTQQVNLLYRCTDVVPKQENEPFVFDCTAW